MYGKLRMTIFIWMMLMALASCRKNKTVPFPERPESETPAPDDDIPKEPEPEPVHVQEARHIAVNENIGGFYEALPPGYDTSTKNYPLLVFLHGGGELGDGNRDLPLILKNAVPRMLNRKTFPVSFRSGDTDYSFIVISPQFIEWPRVKDVNALITYALDHYRVDTHRVYLSGLSMGGGATWEYAGNYGKKLAAIVPICGASWADSTVARRIAWSGVPNWSFHNLDDQAVPASSTRRYVNIIKTQNPAIPPKMTLWETGGHDAWTKACDPDYREDDMNIYEWMLQYTR